MLAIENPTIPIALYPDIATLIVAVPAPLDAEAFSDFVCIIISSFETFFVFGLWYAFSYFIFLLHTKSSGGIPGVKKHYLIVMLHIFYMLFLRSAG